MFAPLPTSTKRLGCQSNPFPSGERAGYVQPPDSPYLAVWATWPKSIRRADLTHLGSQARCPSLPFFGWEGSPKIDTTEKRGNKNRAPASSNLSNLEELVTVCRFAVLERPHFGSQHKKRSDRHMPMSRPALWIDGEEGSRGWLPCPFFPPNLLFKNRSRFFFPGFPGKNGHGRYP